VLKETKSGYELAVNSKSYFNTVLQVFKSIDKFKQVNSKRR